MRAWTRAHLRFGHLLLPLYLTAAYEGVTAVAAVLLLLRASRLCTLMKACNRSVLEQLERDFNITGGTCVRLQLNDLSRSAPGAWSAGGDLAPGTQDGCKQQAIMACWLLCYLSGHLP